jgi:hypothetical protein
LKKNRVKEYLLFNRNSLIGFIGAFLTGEYNTVKPAIHFWLLTLHYQSFAASTIASFITIIGYLAVADLWHISLAYLKNHSMDLR